MSQKKNSAFNFSAIMPYLIAFASFLVLSIAYFYPQLDGKKINQSDITSFESMAQESKKHLEETGKYPLWTNSMFGGMPTYQLGARQNKNINRYFEKLANLFLKRPIGYFFAAMLVFFILLRSFNINTWLSAIGAIAFSFSTNNLILFEAGHTSKLRVVIFSALVIAGFVNTYRKKYLLGAALYTIGMGVSLYANHPQMTYILGIILAIYAVFKLIESIQLKELNHFIKATAFILIGTGIALGTSASKLMTTYEYMKDTMRGKPILENSAAGEISSSTQDGLAWDYAMSWSNGTIDLFSAIIPGVAGGSSAEPLSENSAVRKDIRKKGANVDFGPIYWGKLPGTSGPIYFGAIMMFLFVLSMIVLKGPLKWGFGLATLVTFMLSMGANLEWFNRIFFDYFPMFNKFRTPNSILSVTALIIPLMGILALDKVLNKKVNKKLAEKQVYIAGGISAAICLFFVLLGPTMFDFSTVSDSRYASAGYSLDAIQEDRVSLMRADALRSLFFILLSIGVLIAFLKGKLKWTFSVVLIGLFVLFDMWGIGKRYVNTDDFKAKRQYQNNHALRNVDELILKDTDLYFRVHDISADPFNSSAASYHHKTIGGYHPAKLQRYQDMIDTYIARGNMNVLNMLNTKYIILNDEQQKPTVQVNAQAFGNAWFVDTILTVPSNDLELNSLANANLRTTAFVHKDFQEYVNGVNSGGAALIDLTSYSPEVLEYSTNSSSEAIAVFSDIWYGPNKGWQAYIDGEPVEHIRANYCLRALRIPAGKHTIKFEFNPSTFRTGEMISLISSILVLGLLGYLIFPWVKTRFKS